MDQQPKIPTLKDAQKPQVKIKGMGAGLTLFDRLKQFKKKDLAFILAGLGTLFMAPLAEHFMMAPESASDMAPGFRGGGSGGNFFGSGSSPYENGNNNIASGGAIGGGGDIITPLNVRDPSALVMGPGSSQQPPAGSVAPPVAPAAPSRSETDYKDALAGAASRAASAAVKKSPLPVPKVALGGSGLRGLGVAGGGTSASGSLGPINGGNLGKAGTGGGGLNMVRATPNFKGVAGPRGPNSPQGLDGTKRAGANAGDQFSRTGSALSGLNAAASEQIPTGGQGFGGGGAGGAGANDKPFGGSGPGGSKSVGESLAFIEAKERMMENMKLEFEKRKLKDPELLLYKIRNDALTTIAGDMAKNLGKKITGWMDWTSAGAAKTISCPPHIPAGTPLTAAQGNMCEKPEGGLDCFVNRGPKWYYFKNAQTDVKCTVTDAKGESSPENTEGGVSGVNGGVNGGANGGANGGLVQSPAAKSVDKLCSELEKTIAQFKTPSADGTRAVGEGSQAAYEAMKLKAGDLLTARNSLQGGNEDAGCGKVTKLDVRRQHEVIKQHLVDTKPDMGVLPRLGEVAAQTTEKGTGPLGTATGKIGNVATLLGDAEENMGIGKTALTALNNYAFKLPPAEAGNLGNPLSDLLGEANKLKTELDDYLANEATTRQAALKKAHTDANTAAGGAPKLLAVNTEFEKMKAAMPNATIPDIEAPPADGAKAEAPAAIKDYSQVTTAVTAAQAAIVKVCGADGKGCTPAEAPAAGAEPAPKTEMKPEVKEAVDAVKKMRDAQRGYVGGVQQALTGGAAPAEAKDTETKPAADTAAAPEAEVY